MLALLVPGPPGGIRSSPISGLGPGLVLLGLLRGLDSLLLLGPRYLPGATVFTFTSLYCSSPFLLSLLSFLFLPLCAPYPLSFLSPFSGPPRGRAHANLVLVLLPLTSDTATLLLAIRYLGLLLYLLLSFLCFFYAFCFRAFLLSCLPAMPSIPFP